MSSTGGTRGVGGEVSVTELSLHHFDDYNLSCGLREPHRRPRSETRKARNMQIQNTVALVTGGASGLGRATAEALVARGGKVVVLDLPDSLGETVAAELGASVRFAPADVRDSQAVQAAVD